MRIAIISTMAGNPWGGSEELWYSVALLARQQGHEVAASVYKWQDQSPKIDHLQKSGVKIFFRARLHYKTIAGKAKAKILQKTIALSDLKSVLSFNPDLLVVNQGSLVDVGTEYHRSFFEDLKVPYCNIIHVNTENDVLSSLDRGILKSIYGKSERVYFVSERNKEAGERMLCYRFANSEIITNPIGFENITVVPYPDNDVLKFAIVGRIDVKVKGHSILLEILSRQEWKERKWHLNIYGKGPDEIYIKELCSFYGLQDRITFHGHVSDLRNSIWANNHLLLMPSTQEGCPIALVEAMVCGRAAVVSDVGGNAELIQEGFNGFVAAAASPNSFGKAMERMWSEKQFLKDMGIRAHELALKKVGADPVRVVLDNLLALRESTTS